MLSRCSFHAFHEERFVCTLGRPYNPILLCIGPTGPVYIDYRQLYGGKKCGLSADLCVLEENSVREATRL